MEEYKQTYPVQLVLACFGVPRATYYHWRTSMEGETSHPDEVTKKIGDLCIRYHFIYGYRTIKRLLCKEFNLTVNAKKVYRIMKENGWLLSDVS